MRRWKRTKSRNCLAWTQLTVQPLFTREVLLVRVISESSVHIGEEQNRRWLIWYGSCMHEHWQKAASCYGNSWSCKEVVECAPILLNRVSRTFSRPRLVTQLQVWMQLSIQVLLRGMFMTDPRNKKKLSVKHYPNLFSSHTVVTLFGLSMGRPIARLSTSCDKTPMALLTPNNTV